MSRSVISGHQLHSDLVPSPVDYRVLRPASHESVDASDRLPLVLFLHGGGGSADFLDSLQPVIESLWAEGSLPPAVFVTPSAGRSFYLDRFDGHVRYETFVFDALLPHLLATTGAGQGGGAVAIAGVSMGGLGALRLAFRRPDRFVAVAAVEPAIEEATHWDDVLVRDRVYRDDALMHEMYGDPIDAEHFQHHHPRAIAERHGHLIAAAGLDVYVECGDEDLLHLQYGAEALHRQLMAHGIDHEYRLVRGANHVGATLGPRFADALRFVGRSLRAVDTPAAADPMVEWFAQYVASMEGPSGYRRTVLVDAPHGTIEVHVQGQGPAVVLIPSLGRGASDFDALSARLARAGYQVIAPEPRGIGGSTGLLDGLTLADLANDMALAIRGVGASSATVVGHALGNRIARMVATDHPDLVESVVLLACGGRVPPSPEAATALFEVFDPSLSPEAHLAAVQLAFFAPGNDPAVWRDGWHADVAAAQSAAVRATSVDTWWEAGGADVLVVQPADDTIALPANGHDIVERLGGRASMITIPHAGHALLPEQPKAVAVALLTWLDRRVRGRSRG